MDDFILPIAKLLCAEITWSIDERLNILDMIHLGVKETNPGI